MLQQMGLRVWWPETVAVPPLAAAESATVQPLKTRPADLTQTRTQGTSPATPSQLLALPDGIGNMDWTTLAQTIAQCQACKLCLGRRGAVFAAAPRRADWLVLGEPPDDNEERLVTPFAGPAGQLLDNMLKAVGVRRLGVDGGAAPVTDTAGAAYVSNVVKCRPSPPRNPQPEELAACENYLRRELALVQPKVMLALGRFAAQTLLQGSVPGVAGIPLGKLRGQVYRYQGIPVVVSYHPAYLLRTPQDKARTWADLCLALEAANSA